MKGDLRVLKAHMQLQLDPIQTRPASWQATRDQIGLGALMNLGARNILRDDENGTVTFTIGTGGVYGRRAVIRLQADDLYRVDIVSLKRTGSTTVEASAEGLYADTLAETLIRLHHEVTHG